MDPAIGFIAVGTEKTRHADGVTEPETEAKRLDEAYREVRRQLRRRILRRVLRAGRVEGGPLARRYAAATASLIR